MKSKILLLFICMLAATFGYSKQKVYRHPAVNSDGSRIAFTFQGDIWTVPVNGGEAKRLTVHKAYDSAPVWSADNRNIVFASSRDGRSDVYSIPADGGLSKRLTWHPAGDTPYFVTKKGKVLLNTSRTFRKVEWMGEIYSVPLKGGTPERFADVLGSNASISEDGKFMAFERGACRTTREAYNGPADRDIWVEDLASKSYWKLTDFEGNDYNPKWSGSDYVYYLSSKSGRYNIWKVKREKGSKSEQVTFSKDFGIESFDVSRDGKTIVFNKKGSIYTMKTTGGKPALVAVKVNSDYRFNPVEFKKLSGGVSSYAVSGDSEFSAFITRGEVFVTSNKKGNKVTRNVSRSIYRETKVEWLNKNNILFVRNIGEGSSIFVAAKKGKSNENFLTCSELKVREIYRSAKQITGLVKSNNSKKIAFVEGRGTLVVFKINPAGKLSDKKELTSGWATPGQISWSPDNRWLAYSKEDLNFNSEVYIQSVNGGKPVNVSMHPRGDHSPVWSKDGSKLGFISQRNNGDDDIWFAWLKKSDWEKSKSDWELEELSKPEKKKKPKASKKSKNKSKKKAAPKPVIHKIDIDGIYKRLVQVTSMPGDERGLAISKDGKWFFYSASSPATGKRDLFKTKWDLSSTRQITRGGRNPYALKADKKGSFIYMLSRGRLSRVNTRTGKPQGISFSAKLKIDHVKERELIFKEASTALKNNFYDPGFHGLNWDKLVTKYKNYVLSASTNTDFMDLYNLMIGQLNASHMGMRMRPRESVRGAGTGLLGIEVKAAKEGVKVVNIVKDSPADKLKSKLYKGDVILSVDDMKIEKGTNFYSLLEGKSGERVMLRVKGKTDTERNVLIRPTRNLRMKLYYEWVENNRKLVDKLSGGKLGYLHIQGMNWTSFERFEREIAAAGHGKEGILVDVRYNGGGWTTDYLMAVLNVKQHAYTVPRGATDDLNKNHKKFRKYYAYGERLPFAAWTKPSIALCNECSYSNAEIFSHAYKTLGIGKLVGRPTFGAVISTGGVRLMDGSTLRMPFRAWYVKATDQNMENGPAVPDMIVENHPDEKIKGVDSQLKKAVKELLKDIK